MQSPFAFLRGVAHPEAFHGVGKTGGFFEGWYVKLVSADLSQRWAVIPGIFRGLETTEDTAFVQVLDGLTGRSWFHRFPIDEFEAATDRFEVRVGGNHFTAEGSHLELPQLSGDIRYITALDPWPVTPLEPGIMGWYGLVPAMECFHAIVSFGHKLNGTLEVEGKPINFDQGRGYIEKDWGKAFPAGYVWLASNHIENEPEASLVASVAIIPWLRSSFRGFIIGFKHSGKLHKWSTYNRSKEASLAIDDSHVHWAIDGPDGRLELKAERVRGGLLHAPLRTAMYQRVEETLDSTVEIRHLDRAGKLLYEGKAVCAGLEVFGDIERLLAH